MYLKTTSVGYIYHDRVSRIRMYLTTTSVKKEKIQPGIVKEQLICTKTLEEGYVCMRVCVVCILPPRTMPEEYS